MDYADVMVPEIVHEALRIYARTTGEDWPHWRDLPDHTQYVTAKMVEFVTCRNDTLPEDLHNKWFTLMTDSGWIYGPRYSYKEKTHPNLLSWDKLPEHQQKKDIMFISVCKSVNEINGNRPQMAYNNIVNFYQGNR